MPSTVARTERSVARRLAETADPRDAPLRALEAIGQGLGWRFGAVWEPVRDVLRCVDTWHAPGVDAREFEAESRGLALAPGEGLPGRVWSDAEPAWLADVLADDNFPRLEAARRAGLRAAFCFPLIGASGVLGVIELYSGDTADPNPDLLATMSALGDQIVQALEHRRDVGALRAKDARHRAMLEAALDCVVIMDDRGRVIDFNPAAERTFGYRAADVVGCDMAELIVPPSLRARHRAALERYVQTGSGSILDRRVDITGMRADGTEFPVELTITQIDVPGPPTFAGYLRDITDRKAAEAELRASRVRIVEAADEARRRLERDLHDGAQQRLVELALDLRMAQARLADGPADARELLDGALGALTAATAELRELARGIHPAALTEGGLRPALDALVMRARIPARVRAAPERRFPPAVEATAYFTVAEALTNAARHAGARLVEITAVHAGQSLRVEVRDDGCGGADAGAGSGLRGLADRAAALGGELSLTSPPGGGTVLTVEIPCDS